MEKEKKPRTVKKKETTAKQSGIVQSIESKKPATKKRSTVTEINAPAAAPKKIAARRKTLATPTAAEPKTAQMKISDEEVARLAHRYWAERGGQHGNHVDDWLRAERELRGKAS